MYYLDTDPLFPLVYANVGFPRPSTTWCGWLRWPQIPLQGSLHGPQSWPGLPFWTGELLKPQILLGKDHGGFRIRFSILPSHSIAPHPAVARAPPRPSRNTDRPLLPPSPHSTAPQRVPVASPSAHNISSALSEHTHFPRDVSSRRTFHAGQLRQVRDQQNLPYGLTPASPSGNSQGRRGASGSLFSKFTSKFVRR